MRILRQCATGNLPPPELRLRLDDPRQDAVAELVQAGIDLFGAAADGGEGYLQRAEGLQLLTDALEGFGDCRRVHFHVVILEGLEGEQPGQADGGLESGRVRGQRILDAVDVSGADIERGDAGRGGGGGEYDQPHGRVSV